MTAYKSPYGPIWHLINSRDRNRVYEILERCDAAPNWFQDDANGIIERKPIKNLVPLKVKGPILSIPVS